MKSKEVLIGQRCENKDLFIHMSTRKS